jgi:hypothetical protein
MNDGFLFVWSINLRSGAARLHSTNKCTSFVRDMCWMGRSIITYVSYSGPELEVIDTLPLTDRLIVV